MKILTRDLQLLFEHYPGLWGCQDGKSRFLYVNRAFAKAVGIEKPTHLVEKTAYDLPGDLARYAPVFQEQDREVRDKRLALKILDIHPFGNNKWAAFVFTKVPFLDAEHNFVGTIFHASRLPAVDNTTLAHFVANSYGSLGQDALPTTKPPDDVERFDRAPILTNREEQLVFFITHNKTLKDVAQVLRISTRTVEKHIEAIKQKFAASSRADLIQKATSAGYKDMIPESLMKSQISIVLERSPVDWSEPT